MNPALQQALSSILNHFLTLAAGYFVTRGVWTGDEAKDYVAAAVLALLSLGWSLYKRYIERLTLDAAIAAPPDTLKHEIAATAKADATTLGFLTGSRKSDPPKE